MAAYDSLLMMLHRLSAFEEQGLDRCSDDGQLFFECVDVRGGGAASFEGRDAGSREGFDDGFSC